MAHEPHASMSLMFLLHFDVFCDLLLNRHAATWNLFVLYNVERRKSDILTSYRLTVRGFVPFWHFWSCSRCFSSLLLLVFLILLAYSFSEKIFISFTCSKHSNRENIFKTLRVSRRDYTRWQLLGRSFLLVQTLSSRQDLFLHRFLHFFSL